MDTLVDIITIEDLGEKLPRWDPTSSSHLHALVDMGSNGIRFSISDLSPPHTRLLKCIYRERAAISLFDALTGPSSDQAGTRPLAFPDETIKLVSQTLARFRSIAVDNYGVPSNQVMVFATEAMRKAQNAMAMLEAIGSEAPGLAVHILAPQVETLFGSVGARSGFPDVKGLFLDLGGGSVQMTYMDTYAARIAGQDEHRLGYEVTAALAGESLPFGAARLIRVLDAAEPQVQASELSTLNRGMSEAFEKLRAKFPSLADTVTAVREMPGSSNDADSTGLDVYLCGGGFRGYGSMLMHNDPIQPYPIPVIGSYTVSGNLFARTKDMLEINKTFKGKIFGMSKRRRAQFPAIIAVVDALIAALPRIRSVTFCAGGNREGALMMKLPQSIRESNPLSQLYDDLPSFVTPTREYDISRLQDVVDTLLSAFPENLDIKDLTTVFKLDLGHLYASQIWESIGNDDDANAAAALHNAATRDPGCPGLAHLARAVFGLSLCARWGGGIGPIHQQMYQNLRSLASASDPDATFWADYTGAVAAVLTWLVPAMPTSKAAIDEIIRFHCAAETGKKTKIRLNISISDKLADVIRLQDLSDLFKDVGKRTYDKKVIVATTRFH